MRKFTLIELIVTITCLGILASIILVNIADIKKKAITSSMQQNIAIIQSEVDTFYLKKESYPIKNEDILSLENPQLIDVDILVENGFQKKKLDTSKIKNQYYWVDVFGKVWGSTYNEVSSLNLIKKDQGYSLEALIGSKYSGYNLYEVQGYKAQNGIDSQLEASLNAGSKYYKIISEVLFKDKEEQYIVHSFDDSSKTYLFSMVDEYGLEAAPKGKFASDSQFKPIIRGEGEYEFEITGADTMYWIDFKKLDETPGKSTIQYLFTVKDENGEYIENWTNDYFSLDPSKGIKVKVIMKGDDEGNKPSLLDLRIIFKYEDDYNPEIKPPGLTLVNPDPDLGSNSCPSVNLYNTLDLNSKTNYLSYLFEVPAGESLSSIVLPKETAPSTIKYTVLEKTFFIESDGAYVPYVNQNTEGKCMYVTYTIEVIDSENSDPNSGSNGVSPEMCPYVNLYNTLDLNRKTNSLSYLFKVEAGESLTTTVLPKVSVPTKVKYTTLDTVFFIEENGSYIPYVNQSTDGKCMYVTYTIEFADGVVQEGDQPLCGSGGSVSRYVGSERQIVYTTYLGENQYLTNVEKPLSHPTWVLKSMSIETSYKGAEYKQVSNVKEIKDQSCVNFVYVYSYIFGFPPEPPTIDICEGSDCVPPTCKENCIPTCIENCDSKDKENFCSLNPNHANCQDYCVQYGDSCIPNPCGVKCLPAPPTGPTEGDKELEDPEWTTVDRVRFFGHGAMNQLTRWYKVEHSDSINKEINSDEISLSLDENTRIVYRYAKANGSYWSQEYVDFTKTDIASSVMGVAYIQVKTTEKDTITSDQYPTVESMRFYNEKGYLDMSMVQPTLTILAQKDNNGDRNVYSDESNIEWTYDAADPRNKKIVDIEWEGDKRTDYAVGTYEIKARVKNEVEVWSEWVEVEIEVLQEKPISHFEVKTLNGSKFLDEDTPFEFVTTKSVDPDGDKIVNSEWKNKLNKYPVGSHLVSYRIQDEEGYWSDWFESQVTIASPVEKLYRIEGEDMNPIRLLDYGRFTGELSLDKYGLDNLFYPSESYSNKNSRWLVHSHAFGAYNFNGSGLNIKLGALTKDVIVLVDRGTKDQQRFAFNVSEGLLLEIRGLSEGKHTVHIMSPINHQDIHLDYMDVLGEVDKPRIHSVYSNSVLNGIETKVPISSFSPQLNQELKTYYSLEKDAFVTINFINSKGDKVYTYKNPARLEGGTIDTHFYTWDGKDSKGTIVPSGYYEMEVVAKGVLGKETTTYKHKFYLSNDNPTMRIEGEDTSPVRILAKGRYNLDDSNSIEFNDKYSDGKGYVLNHALSYIAFKFEGNGFDLSIPNVTHSIDVIIDKGTPSEKIYKFTTGTNYLLSERDMTQGSHTVHVDNLLNHRPTTVDYLEVYSLDDKPKISNVYSHAILNGVETKVPITSFSPPLGQDLKTYFTLERNAKVTFNFVNSKGEKVYSYSNSTTYKGGTTDTHSYTWNGKGFDNKIVPSDFYNVEIVAKGVLDKETTTYRHKVYLSNDTPTMRIEGDDTSSLRILAKGRYGLGDSNGLNYNEAHSEGKAYVLPHALSYIAFKFEGNGFDLSMPLITHSVQVIIDKGTSNEKVYNYLAGTNIILSERELNQGSHTLHVDNLLNHRETIVDYLDVYSLSDKPTIHSLSPKVIFKGIETNYEVGSFAPNLGQELKLKFSILRNATVSVKVISPKNKEVMAYKYPQTLLGGTVDSHIFSLKESDTHSWDSGLYTIEITALGVLGKETTTSRHSVYISNEVSTDVLEGENISDSRFHDYGRYGYANANSVTINSSYSNGKAYTIPHNLSYVGFKFEGTGFDIYLPNTATNAIGNIIIDKGTPNQKIYSLGRFGELMFTIRNLPKGTHTVHVDNLENHNPINVDYINFYNN